MYQYQPNHRRSMEKLLTIALFFIGILFFLAVPLFPSLPYPVLYQGLGLISLTGGIMVISLCLMRNYTYSLEYSDQNGSEMLDFVVTEQYGRRITVVCRVAASAIKMSAPVRPDTKARLRKLCKHHPTYTYTGLLFLTDDQYLLRIQTDETTFFVRICADKGLISRFFA